MIRVFCLDENKEYWFAAKTPYEAMKKMKYTLDLAHKDKNCVINMTPSAKCLYMEHGGKTYSAVL